MKDADQRPVGIIGAGNFGKAVANIIAENRDVLLFTRQPDKAQRINTTHEIDGVRLSARVFATTSLKELAEQCRTIFPIVPSRRFREMMQDLAPYLNPSHFLIHGTKGFALRDIDEDELPYRPFTRKNVCLMSEVIRQESCVLRIGTISGPNLAKEILAGKPAGTLVSSNFEEVIQEARLLLSSERFRVFTSTDVKGTELAGALKNIIAILSGILAARDMGLNLQALLITKGLAEMIRFAKGWGADEKTFLGTAGIGDLIATAMSPDSRNYRFGYRIGSGERLIQIQANLNELVEGIRTLIIVYHLSRHQRLRLPIIHTLYRIVFEDYPIEEAVRYLMTFPFDVDVNFLD